MKIFISTDLEGVTGVWRFKQTRERETEEFHQAVKFLMHDIAAVAEGLIQAGAKEIYASDGHGGGNNFLPELMVSGVHYITGKPRPRVLDESFDGYIMLGYHAMNGTPDGVLHHTQSSVTEHKYFYDGIERGEIFQSGAVAGHYNVPVILVTGDEATCKEARLTFGEDIPTVAVKKGLNREAAILLSTADTKKLLIEGAIKSIEMLPQMKPLKVKLPMKIQIRKLVSNANASSDNPYFEELNGEVRDIKDIYSGSKP
jgi:D-amino peptidase